MARQEQLRNIRAGPGGGALANGHAHAVNLLSGRGNRRRAVALSRTKPHQTQRGGEANIGTVRYTRSVKSSLVIPRLRPSGGRTRVWRLCLSIACCDFWEALLAMAVSKGAPLQLVLSILCDGPHASWPACRHACCRLRDRSWRWSRHMPTLVASGHAWPRMGLPAMRSPDG